MPGTRVIGGTIGRKEARINTGVVAHFGGFNFEREYPDPEPITKVRITVPKVIVRLLKICLTKFCPGSAKVRKLPNQNEKSKLEPIIDLLGRKARIAIQMIGIRVITIVIKMNNSKGILTLDL
jgi:hypothetical protein